MAFLIGQCENNPLAGYPGSGGTSGGSGSGGTTGGSYLGNEEVTFTNLATLTIFWNSTRIARFGTSGSFYVEILGDDGIYRRTDVQAVPDVIPGTTRYDFDFGGPATGRITIS